MTEKDLEQFKNKLVETTSFPTVYMYKFIVEADNRNIAMVENLFDDDAEIHTKQSGNGKYISITCKQVSTSAEEIIELYRKASQIKGIMFL